MRGNSGIVLTDRDRTLLNELTDQSLPTHYGPPRAGDVLHSHADISRARELLGYRPTVNVREGLRRTLEWYKQENRD